ncbi:efflux RND transporter periplasmic adaptor subunit [Caldimonas thermodepolymerans]|jgi:RND family efflux transporter, MFP subunit|uniref:Efflux transporter periplasmic adaptor subunit n=1 Tax=Caldimonas thermodepolymerans TaxID=215580 RepID=A0A2S5T8B1_9BURK|nr:efflux RND transporter periplasmic adaptor subunit [Caldimonas thermodepolymerans]PPE71118.1 efflux transporter periplasmic adaptor subunit [Caldimonas thermodepolymerans]QPC31422.1 efflux RND transporter periplasmic adaptor subunit [Caldimonas thermodepolymerans]RDH99607.1 macrolide-specific efflux system membrane fusion protein [Caldimonas thermodepolymerans]UZG44168.1 efflux RND transporter periplasmic adaptor subunit [Caldimonas thermodepolymerans]
MAFRVSPLVRNVLLAAVVAVAAFAGWRYYAARTAQPTYVTAEVRRGAIEDTVLATGTLMAYKQVNVGAQVSGQVKSLKVALGDRVKKGQLVAEIDSMTQRNALLNAEAALANVRAQLRSAEAQLEQQRLTLRRQEQMRAADATSQADLEAAQAAFRTSQANVEALKAQVEQARISLETAKVNLGYTQITSPIDGQVVAVVTEEGTTVNANQSAPTIIIVAQTDVMTVKASISEADVVTVKPGQRVYFTVLGEPEHRYEATLRTIEPATDAIASSSSGGAGGSSSSSATSATAIYYNGLFDVPNPDGKLRISMTANVHIVRGEARDALIIPSSALGAVQGDGRRVVKVLDAQGRVQERLVRVGMDNNVQAQVLEGLNEGEKVITGTAAPASAPQGGQPMRMPRRL